MADLPDLSKQLSSIAFPIPRIEVPRYEVPAAALKTAAEANYASEFYERLITWINRFDESLDDQHEVGVRLVSFGQTVVFHLENIGYWNPSLISFKGKTDDRNPVELIQHVTQISILLTKLPRRDPNEPKQKVGFHHKGVDDEA